MIRSPRILRRFLTASAVAAALLAGGFPPLARAASPQLNRVLPRGGQRGTEVDLALTGLRLGDAREALFYEPGLTATAVEPQGPTAVKVHVRIAPDAPLGEHSLRLRCDSGITELRTFFVGPYPTVAPATQPVPNQFEQPQKIALNTTVEGVINSEVVHYFEVEAKKGQRLSAEVEGMRLGGALFDPYVAILDKNRFELASADDTALLKQDGFASAIVPRDGSYVVVVRESAFGGSSDSYYRLHVGTFPRPKVCFPCGGPAGEKMKLALIGDVGGPIEQTVQLPNEPADEFAVWAEQGGQMPPSPNWFRVVSFPNVMESEPNNDLQHATPVPLPAGVKAATQPAAAQAAKAGAKPQAAEAARVVPTMVPVALNGVISEPGDVDFWRFTARKDVPIEITVWARRLRSPLDSVLVVYNAQGSQIAANDDSGGPDSYLRFAPPADGDYFLSVRDHLMNGGPDYVYRVELTRAKPTIVLSIPPASQIGGPTQERQTVVVPRGNRYATMVRALRQGVGGELQLIAPDLPAGITMHAEPIAPGTDMTLAVFEAAPDAPVAGKLCELSAHLTDPKNEFQKTVTGQFLQNVALVVGNPGNTSYHEVHAHQLAAAVAEEVPFSIRVIPPKVPIVQNGSMSLRVAVERREGFAAPINLRLPYTPAGVSAQATVEVPAGATEASIPLSASEGAKAGKYKFVVLASADVTAGAKEEPKVAVAAAGKGAAAKPVSPDKAAKPEKPAKAAANKAMTRNQGGLAWVSSPLADLEVAPPFVTGKIAMTAVEQGQAGAVTCELEPKTPFEGKAKVQLLGLPANAAAVEKEVSAADTKVTFDVTTAANTPAGQHAALFCRLTLVKEGESIVHDLGRGGILRVDAPRPPKAGVKPTPAPVAAAPKPATSAVAKPLSRLEKLRLEQAEAKEGK